MHRYLFTMTVWGKFVTLCAIFAQIVHQIATQVTIWISHHTDAIFLMTENKLIIATTCRNLIRLEYGIVYHCSHQVLKTNVPQMQSYRHLQLYFGFTYVTYPVKWIAIFTIFNSDFSKLVSKTFSRRYFSSLYYGWNNLKD